MRFIRWGLGNSRSNRCEWELDGFDEWEGFNDGRRWKRIYKRGLNDGKIWKKIYK